MSKNEDNPCATAFKGEMKSLVNEFHTDCDPDRLEEILDKLKGIVSQMRGLRSNPLSKDVKEWVSLSSGNFRIIELMADLGIKSDKDRKNVNKIIQRLVKDGELKANNQRGSYRIIKGNTQRIDHMNADDSPIPIILPFDIHEYMEWFPRGIMVVAGDSDAGKTAMMFNLALNNKSYFSNINYIATEMGAVLLKRRLKKMAMAYGISYPEAFKHINFLEPKTTSYMDMVSPDGLTIIDYYELTDDFYRIADYLRQIYDNLKTGSCFVAVQKKTGNLVGRGGDFAMEKPLLYISMNRDGTARIMKAKMDKTKEFDPYRTIYRYKIHSGGRIEYYREPTR